MGCEQGVQSNRLELSKEAIRALCSLAGICHFYHDFCFSEIQSIFLMLLGPKGCSWYFIWGACPQSDPRLEELP